VDALEEELLPRRCRRRRRHLLSLSLSPFSGAAGVRLGKVSVGPLPFGVRDDLYLPGWQGRNGRFTLAAKADFLPHEVDFFLLPKH
jgi:hypothetical protein